MNSKSNHILIPVDFSEQSLIAVSQSYNIARLYNSEITLLHVIDEDFLDKLKSLFTGNDEYETKLQNETQLKLKELAARIEAESGLKVNVLITSGKIYDEIVRVANDLNTVFIIMGTNGPEGIKKKFIGSNAMRVINESNCPVISIKGKKHHEGCKRIVLPLDLSRESRDKVNKTIEIAKYFNSEIHLVSLHDTHDEYLLSKLDLQMKSVEQFIEDAGIKVITKILKSSDIARSVLDYAIGADADLIVIISQAEPELAEWFLGSAAQEIINNSDVPVMSIKAIKRKDTFDYSY
jgi:nucleotide-binding universal stress UspA family protein